jgi:hypothetical protein
MDDITALHHELAKLRRRAARWKHAAKENREKMLYLADNMDGIINDILDELNPEELINIYQKQPTVH